MPGVGLEPTSLSTHRSERCLYTNFNTLAKYDILTPSFNIYSKINYLMKSNISQKEISSGIKTIELLKKSNPILSPHTLKKYITEYRNFTPQINQYGLWFSPKYNQKISTKYNKIVFLLNGLAASGKDAIFSEIIRLNPRLFFKTVTATSRLPRENEIDNVDYFFYKDILSFESAIKKNEFIEYLKRGDTFYGLPKKSFEQAFNQPKPIIYCQIEMSGWSKLEQYIDSLNKNILVIKAFILPNMNISDYLNWLVQNRGKEDIESRISKSGWELKEAPHHVDFFVINRINTKTPTLTYTAKTIINSLTPFIKNPKINKYPTPTDNLKPTENISQIVKIHNFIV